MQILSVICASRTHCACMYGWPSPCALLVSMSVCAGGGVSFHRHHCCCDVAKYFTAGLMWLGRRLFSAADATVPHHLLTLLLCRCASALAVAVVVIVAAAGVGDGGEGGRRRAFARNCDARFLVSLFVGSLLLFFSCVYHTSCS